MELTEEAGPTFHMATQEILLLFSENRAFLIQVGPRLIAVNCLRPYPTWPGFRSRIEKAWNFLREVVEVQGLEYIGLRYINQIYLPETSSRLEDYFEFYPYLGPSLPQDNVAFTAGSLFAYHEGRDQCRLQLNNAPVSPGEPPAVFLDIEYFLAQSKAVKPEEVFEWLEEAHRKVEEIFEASITERLRTMFQPEV